MARQAATTGATDEASAATCPVRRSGSVPASRIAWRHSRGTGWSKTSAASRLMGQNPDRTSFDAPGARIVGTTTMAGTPAAP